MKMRDFRWINPVLVLISLEIFFGVMNLANPILGIKPAHFTPITIIIEFFLFFINLIFIYLIYHLFKKNKA